MIIKVAQHFYEMEKPQAEKLLQLAKEQVPCGVYALQRKEYIELCNQPMTKSQAKKTRLAYKREGIKAYVNGV